MKAVVGFMFNTSRSFSSVCYCSAMAQAVSRRLFTSEARVRS
jgi:hypothetical protein